MTESELDAELQRLQLLQKEINAAIHDLLNGLTVVKAEVDLAIEHTRALVSRFYERFPDWKP